MTATFFINEYQEDGTVKWKPIKGNPVTFSGFEDCYFFIAKSNPENPYHKWGINEARTGCLIETGPTKKAAIDAANKYLQRKTVDDIKRAIKEFTQKYGETKE